MLGTNTIKRQTAIWGSTLCGTVYQIDNRWKEFSGQKWLNSIRAWSVPWISKTHARQNETLRICKIHTGWVFGPSVGQFRGNSLGGLGLRHAFVTLVRNLEDTQLYIFRVKAEL